MSTATTLPGPDLTQGIARSALPDDGVFAGHVGDDPVILANVDGEIVAVGGVCSHYSGPLKDGLRVGATIKCPWHHACFDLRSGRALKAPALSPLDRWKVEEAGGRIVVREKLAPAPAPSRAGKTDPKNIVIVGGGAAGFACAQRLRDLGYAGEVTLLSADSAAPYDRPNLSKDYLAGEADPAWMPLKDESFYREARIDLQLETTVVGLDTAARRLTLQRGGTVAYDALLLATGAEPNRLKAPGFERDNVHVLRSLADCDRLIAASRGAKAVAIIGASFIGLEVAAALRSRGLVVYVVSPEALPLADKMGPEIGAFLKRLHEDHGVHFHLGQSVDRFDGAQLKLASGLAIRVDFAVQGVGVKPRLGLAEAAGLKTDKGVIVDARMQTSATCVFAAGDIARYPDPFSGALIRVEHWVMAQRQGQVAAAAMLGIDTPLDEPPFFWSAHYDASLRYVGHGESWDRIAIDGSLAKRDAAIRYIKDGRTIAIATIGRDRCALEAAQEMAGSAR